MKFASLQKFHNTSLPTRSTVQIALLLKIAVRCPAWLKCSPLPIFRPTRVRAVTCHRENPLTETNSNVPLGYRVVPGGGYFCSCPRGKRFSGFKAGERTMVVYNECIGITHQTSTTKSVEQWYLKELKAVKFECLSVLHSNIFVIGHWCRGTQEEKHEIAIQPSVQYLCC